MKYDTWNDYFYFIVGASLASGRQFWTGDSDSGQNKKLVNSNVNNDINITKVSNNITRITLNNYK